MLLIIYTYKLFPPYFTGSDICHKSSFCQQSTVTECILNLLDPSTQYGCVKHYSAIQLNSTAWGGGGQLLFLLILCLQIYYLQCLGFRFPKNGMVISVLSTLGYFCLFLMPLNCRGGGGAFFLNSEFDFFWVTISPYKLLQAFPPKHL